MTTDTIKTNQHPKVVSVGKVYRILDYRTIGVKLNLGWTITKEEKIHIAPRDCVDELLRPKAKGCLIYLLGKQKVWAVHPTGQLFLPLMDQHALGEMLPDGKYGLDVQRFYKHLQEHEFDRAIVDAFNTANKERRTK